MNDGLIPCPLCKGAARVPDDWTEEMIRGTPHPDTARADAAERMLKLMVNRLTEDEIRGLCIEDAAFSAWHADQRADRKRIFHLTARLARERATVAATERELAALTGGKES